jgi:carotenoid cleavage dioxygenase
VLKYDFDAGTVTAHDLGAGRHPGEFVFVPESDDAGEDEGWLMGYVHDLGTGTSELVVLDASDMGADPVARVHLPVRVPTGFHGNWIPDRALG